MNLELRSLIAPGDLKNERLTLRALSALDVGDYLVAQTMLIDDYPATSFDHMIWFPFKSILKGDLVVVYTKSGTSREKTLSKGNTAHFFYLDLNEPIWQDENKGAIVLHTPSWESKSAKELERKP
ncbi:hypothetical protein [Salipiger sp. PrR002]|uniref:hypothetical protein n=1 Tax=Salipiger sp. PrR002 TaxID=2706489 RepID=UPI0013B60489|nr:hypothetical protein [Salipiger sp. PrR002]NDW02416.1 hypothetical protein [Salipiger sp. PrR002]NDW59562.1 hypothetical protein [Salipiger sp. PrR004]